MVATTGVKLLHLSARFGVPAAAVQTAGTGIRGKLWGHLNGSLFVVSSVRLLSLRRSAVINALK
jgi:hypothetical protein